MKRMVLSGLLLVLVACVPAQPYRNERRTEIVCFFDGGARTTDTADGMIVVASGSYRYIPESDSTHARAVPVTACQLRVLK